MSLRIASPPVVRWRREPDPWRCGGGEDGV